MARSRNLLNYEVQDNQRRVLLRILQRQESDPRHIGSVAMLLRNGCKVRWCCWRSRNNTGQRKEFRTILINQKQENMKILSIILIASLVVFGSCVDPINNTADEQMAKATAQSMEEANKQIGMPAIVNFQERKLAKMIFELRDDEQLICHAYLVNQFNGQVGQYLGQCLGFGLPYSVQFTNPEKLVRSDLGQYTGEIALPQADPNGLFMPTGLSATWLMLLDSSGSPHPVYIEPAIIVSPFKLHE